MCKISDEALMAYADGDIADDLRRQVEIYLANDPDGQRRLAGFALTGRQLSQIFDQPMREPVPVHLINFVRGGANDRAGASRKWPPEVRYPNKHHPRMLGMSSRTWALAASVASFFAIGASSLFYFERKPDGVDSSFGLATASDGSKIADKVLAAVLETAPSGRCSERSAVSKHRYRPSFTFQASNGEYCRQYKILRVKNSGSSGVACREADGVLASGNSDSLRREACGRRRHRPCRQRKFAGYRRNSRSTDFGGRSGTAGRGSRNEKRLARRQTMRA